MKKVVNELTDAKVHIDEISLSKLYVCRFNCGDIAVATRQGSSCFGWYSIKETPRQKAGTSLCCGLRELILGVLCGVGGSCHEVYQFDSLKDFGNWLSNYPEYGY